MDRRDFLRGAGAVGALAVAPGVLSSCTSTTSSVDYRSLVPELFTPLADAPSDSQVLIIGSGFGGAVAAYRLAQAGISSTVLERGSRWPTDPKREIFTSDIAPDGRGYWHRTSITSLIGFEQKFDDFGGVLDVTETGPFQVFRGAAVGGGSIVYTGATVQPEQRFFDQVFNGLVSYSQMNSTYYPRAMSRIGASKMPDDVYYNQAFAHSRDWDAQVRRAGYTPQKIAGAWNWDVLRKEFAGTVRASASIGESNLGNANGVKRTLTQTYLAWAEATGRSKIYPGHQVESIGRDANGKYLVEVKKIDPYGTVLSTRTLTCDRLFLAAGSLGSTQLLLKARGTGALPQLNEYIGQGFGTNGDCVVARAPIVGGITQGSPSASRIIDERGLPVTLENWYTPVPLDYGFCASLGMALTPNRGTVSYDAAAQKLSISFPTGQGDVADAVRVVNERIAAANLMLTNFEPITPQADVSFTAHPLGGVVMGKAADTYGRVKGYSNLYVTDGSLIPGAIGTVNPSLTITALAERAMDNILSVGS